MQTLIWDKMVTVWPCLTLDIAWWSDLIDISMFTITIIILNGGSFNPHFLHCTYALDFTRIDYSTLFLQSSNEDNLENIKKYYVNEGSEDVYDDKAVHIK